MEYGIIIEMYITKKFGNNCNELVAKMCNDHKGQIKKNMHATN